MSQNQDFQIWIPVKRGLCWNALILDGDNQVHFKPFPDTYVLELEHSIREFGLNSGNVFCSSALPCAFVEEYLEKLRVSSGVPNVWFGKPVLSLSVPCLSTRLSLYLWRLILGGWLNLVSGQLADAYESYIWVATEEALLFQLLDARTTRDANSTDRGILRIYRSLEPEFPQLFSSWDTCVNLCCADRQSESVKLDMTTFRIERVWFRRFI